MELRINTNGKLALFILKGKVGWDNSRILDAQIHKRIAEGCTLIVFNLDEVTFLCSGGIGALLYNMKSVQDKGGDIYIVSGSDYIQFLFATIGFHTLLADRIFATFQEFSDRVLAPSGLSLNMPVASSSLIHTGDTGSDGEIGSAVA